MSFENFLIPAPDLRPALNLGCLMDIPTGRYYIGKHGESILNAGLSLVTGVGGRGNTFKSTLAHFMFLRSLDRYRRATGTVYDAEPPSVSNARLMGLANWMPHIGGLDLVDIGRLLVTDSTVMLGNKFFDGLKKFADYKVSKDEVKKFTGTTPFLDREGKNIKALLPTLAEIDSLSMMPIEAVEAIYDKNDIGASGMNVEALRASGAKSQMLMQLPTLTGTANIYMILTAHAGDDLALDPYAPPQKKLTFLKNKLKFKQVPEKFTFLTNNLWLTLNASVLQHDTSKAPLYPRDSDDNLKGDTDLQVITVQNLRAKNGPTGMPFEIIVSQREGVLVGLTEFNYIKTYNRFGLGGHDKSYYLELLPDVTLQRTTVRGKIDENEKLRRALEITSEMCQIYNLWHDIDEDLICTPKELYEDLKKKGYDWDVLLNTRGYWTFEEDENELPFLSTMDLLKMRAGKYHPYWMEKLAEAA